MTPIEQLQSILKDAIKHHTLTPEVLDEVNDIIEENETVKKTLEEHYTKIKQLEKYNVELIEENNLLKSQHKDFEERSLKLLKGERDYELKEAVIEERETQQLRRMEDHLNIINAVFRSPVYKTKISGAMGIGTPVEGQYGGTSFPTTVEGQRTETTSEE